MSDDDWVCKACKKEIESNSIKIAGARYHLDCFKCVKCGEKFAETGNKNVTVQKDMLFCAVCFVALDSANHDDGDGPARRKYVGAKMHCDSCHEEITGKFTDIGSEELHTFKRFCAKCFATSPPCAKCSMPITKDPVFHPPLGHFHQDCYKCFRCGADAEGEFQGKLMCATCHKKAFADTCEVCRKFIMDESKAVFALKTRFHKECFKCTVCSQDLEDTLRFLVNGKLYCKTHKPAQ